MRNRYEVDDLRETWCFLTIRTRDGESPSLVGWELGDGNANQLVRTESDSSEGDRTASDVCKRLSDALGARRSSDRLLITTGPETMGRLRQALLTCEQTQNPTLRGFRHLSITDVLAEYFAGVDVASISDALPGTQGSETMEGDGAVDQSWRILATIAPLLPAAALRGREL